MNFFQFRNFSASVDDVMGTPYKIKSVHWQTMQCTVWHSRVNISESMASSIQNFLSSGVVYYSLLWKSIHSQTHERLVYTCTLSPVNWSVYSLLVRWWACVVMFSIDHHVHAVSTWIREHSTKLWRFMHSLRLWKLIWASNPQISWKYGPLPPPACNVINDRPILLN